MKIFLKDKVLKETTQEEVLAGQVSASVFDLKKMFGDYTSLDVQSFEVAIGSVFSEWGARSAFDAYCLLCMLDKCPELAHVNPVDWGMYVDDAYEGMTTKDVVRLIGEQAQRLKCFADKMFQQAKDAVVAQAINGTLDLDMNSLDFESLQQFGANLEKTYISDVGNIKVGYSPVIAEWLSEVDAEFSFEVGECGKPSASGGPCELDSGEMVQVREFYEAD